MGFLIKAVFLAVFAFLAQRFFIFVSTGVVFKTIYNHTPGPCQQMKEIKFGSEDIQILPNGLAFISSGMDLPAGNFEKNKVYQQTPEGKIFLIDLNKPNSKPVDLKIKGLQDKINPHGISLFVQKNIISVFVVNHYPDWQDTVDIFTFDPATMSLVHRKRVSNKIEPNMQHINDVHAVGEDQFYFSNFAHNSLNHELQTLLLIPWGSIGYYDGKTTKIVADHLTVPNGVNSSPDQKFLYVATIGTGEIQVYNRHQNGILTFKEALFIGTLADNIDVDAETGSLWVGCHPKFVPIGDYLQNPVKNKAPSQVLKIDAENGHLTKVTEVLSDDGSLIPASSVAARYKTKMLVGSVFSEPIICDIKYL